MIIMPYSYYLAYESPQVDGFLWSTLAIACRSDAKLIMATENDNGVTLIFNKELSQELICALLFSIITTESLYTT